MNSVARTHRQEDSTTGKAQARWKLTVAGSVVGIVFLWFAVDRIDVGAAMNTLRGVQFGWLLTVVACGAAFMVVKSWRWTVLLDPLISREFKLLHQAVYIGTAANLVIAHTGEFVRASLVGKKVGQPISTILGSIALERVLDFVALLFLASLALLLEPRVSDLLWSATLLSLGITVFGIASVIVLSHAGVHTSAIASKLTELLPERVGHWLLAQLRNAKDGLGALKDPAVCVRALLLSVFQWFWIVLAIWASAQAVDVSITFHAAIAVFVLTVIGLTLPSSPAQLGTIQLAFVAGLALMDAEATPAFAASIIYVVMVNGSMMLIGAAAWLSWDHRQSRPPRIDPAQ